MFTVIQRYYDNGNIMISLRRAFSDEVPGTRKEYQADVCSIFIDILDTFDDAIKMITDVREAI
ncbi:hypothetical protein [Acetobacterium sp. KB-1]|jgi:hypothetical protein|uniref:hypothetical protein n=1 Tax=Acetobacterium sp. KB-1 TaxID=2184575 RepID=UPI000DBEB106|nr:hypothetical protein [Acetobacterium sp. KB-1]AWW26992.1 hypothetical protein DOZ58_10315 [Acetobacterium sp. KB-1]